MMKKFVILIACLGLSLQLISCTSSENKQETEVSTDFESADLEKVEGEVPADLTSEQAPLEALGEAKQEDVALNENALPEDPLAEKQEINDDMSNLKIEPVEENKISSVAEPAPVTEVAPPPPTEPISATTVLDEEPVKKETRPLQKMATAPWKVGKTWFNTVYFARPGDSLKSISKMIYGKDKSSELKKGNTTFNSRGVKPGDKVYYSSPNRPMDSDRMLTYYDDNGIAPEVYIAQGGDNLRKVAKNLLGYEGAWKEVWSSNPVESKDAIAEGTEIRYWKGGLVAAAPAVEQPPMPPPQMVPAPEVPMTPPAPPELPQQAQAELPPPPPPEMPIEQAPPPPPPPPVAQVPKNVERMVEVADTETSEDTAQETNLALAVVGLAAGGLALLVVMRKKRKQKELEQQGFDQTHVGT